MPTKNKKSEPKVKHTTTSPKDRIAKYAVNSLYFGMGTAALVADNAQSFVKKAVERGQQVDIFENLGKLYSAQEALTEKLAALPQQPLKFVRSFIADRRSKDPMVTLEARLREEVLRAAERIQNPLKKNIQDLNKKVSNLSNLVAKMAAR